MREIRRTISLGAVENNFRLLQKQAKKSAIAAVVKADAYGLGMAPISRRLADLGCQQFFVATPDEGEALRQLLPEVTIFILNGLSGRQPQAFHQAHLVPVLNSVEEIQRWSTAGELTQFGCAIHIDTGMQRLGLTPEEFTDLRLDSRLANKLNLKLLISHLACAELSQAKMNAEQHALFSSLTDSFSSTSRSLANSSGVFLNPAFHFDCCRAGAALYGVNPQPGLINPMQSVVTVTAPVIQIRRLTQSCSVGYGATTMLPPGTRLATIAAGYADGYPRLASNQSHIQIGEWLVPVVGRVSMDLISVDITALPETAVSIADRVHLLSPMITVDDLAEAANTIGYEILTNLGRHAVTRYVD